MRKLYLFLAVVLWGFGGCSGLVIDRSGPAFAAGDMTLISSCVAAPSSAFGLASGVDSCQFSAGDTISSSWVLVVPPPKTAQQVTGGTVDVYFRDIHKSYPISGWAVPIAFADVLGVSKWTKDLDLGVMEALITINWVDNSGVNQVTQFRGIAVLLITTSGYSRLPINSGNQAWGTTCKVQYSTAGRSALQCK